MFCSRVWRRVNIFQLIKRIIQPRQHEAGLSGLMCVMNGDLHPFADTKLTKRKTTHESGVRPASTETASWER